MNISEKLLLSQKPIVFFREGEFLKVYNQSFFVVKTQLKSNLKPVLRYIKSIDQSVISGGFPIDSILMRFPHATRTEFGYALLHQKWSLIGYGDWFKQNLAQLLAVSATSATSASPQIPQIQQPQTQPLPTFTPEQLSYLSTWQYGKSNATSDAKFIRFLKYQLGM